MKAHICSCVLGHRRRFRLFASWRVRRFYQKTHLHPEVSA